MSATPPPLPPPPTEPSSLADDGARPMWPTYVGIACVVFGAFGILGSCMGGVSTVAMPAMFRNMPDPNGQLAATAEAMQGHLPVMIVVLAVVAATAILLLVGGIQCLRRRVAARKVLMTWAVIKIVVVVGAIVANLPIQRAQLEAQQAAGGAPQAMGFQFGVGFAAVTGACNVIWGWILPVFILIWFTRRNVRDDVDAWFGK